MSVKLTGDWGKTKQVLSRAPAVIHVASVQSIKKEAHALRAAMIQGITRQSPAGAPFTPLSELTLAIRKMRGFSGSKALIDRGDLRNAINVVFRGGGTSAFIGVPRKARSKQKGRMIDVAKVHEFGAGPFIIPKTEKMRRFIFAALKSAGIEPRKSGGRRSGVVVINIPARPFIRPVFESYKKGGFDRFRRDLSRRLNFTG